MIQAPLQLRDYWVDFIQVKANHVFKHQLAPDFDISTIELLSDVKPLEVENPKESGTAWMVNLRIQQKIPKGKNIPYEFALDITGVVAAHPSLDGEKLERAIEVNGPSMLFGAAREILRDATGRGPYAPVIIPSTNFFQRLSEWESDTQKLPASKKTTKKTARKTAKKTTKKKSS